MNKGFLKKLSEETGGSAFFPKGIGDLNPQSVRTVTAQLEPALRDARPEERFQFERHGYFVVDSATPGVFNRTVTLRDSWGAKGAGKG